MTVTRSARGVDDGIYTQQLLRPTAAVWDALNLIAERAEAEASKATLKYWLGFDNGEWEDVEEAFPIVALLREALAK